MRKTKYNKYYFLKDYIIGIANNTGAEFKIDYEDYKLVCNYSWNQIKNQEYLGAYYIKPNGTVTKIKLHRLILGLIDNEDSEKMVDHINHEALDNRKENLRIVTNSQNQMNRTKTSLNTSGERGVYWHKKTNKWQANLQINGKLLYLGLFDNKEDAVLARKNAEVKYFKEYNYNPNK